jgi:hypothetical protein
VAVGSVAGPDLLVDWTTNTYFDYPHGAQIQDTAAASQRFSP